MKLNKKIMMLSILAVIVLGGYIFLKPSHHHEMSLEKDVYYCPMHPQYTSDHPGDCPICNMKLVKKEKPSAAMNSASQKDKSKQDICYLHNCPHLKNGQPCPMLVVAKKGEEVICPICKAHVHTEKESKAEKKILYWTDPMIPGYKADGPGKSPMGMDLVPVYSTDEPMLASVDAPAGYASILLTPQKQQLIGVRTSPAGIKNITKVIRTVGTIAHDPELYQSQAEYIQALQAYKRAQEGATFEIIDQAKRLMDSSYIRLKHLGLSDQLIEEIKTWDEPEHNLLFAHPGDPVWMYAKVYEYELPFIKVGEKIMAEVSSLPGESFSGTIRAIDAMVDPMTRTTRIRAQLEDLKGSLKPDMYVNATIAVDLGKVLTVPEEAVFNTGTKQIVFIDKGEGIFEPRDVVVGAKADTDYQIKDGVHEGERVVTSGNFLIDSESRLKAALEGMGSGDASGGGHQHGQ